MGLEEVRKEDDHYYQGAFWIIGNSVREIKRGNFQLIGIKLLTDFQGNYIEQVGSKGSLTHKRLWPEYNKGFEDKEFNYFPRGRVAIYEGVAYIHINSLFNQPTLIDRVIKEYNLQKLEIEVDCNDLYQGSHYDFKLR